jgi:hypothetical protein
MYIQLEPILSILAGILIMMIPKFLNFIVAFYLILVGVFSLVN